MVFLFIMPGIISSMGISIFPLLWIFMILQLRLNNLAFWLSVLAIQIFVVAIAFEVCFCWLNTVLSIIWRRFFYIFCSFISNFKFTFSRSFFWSWCYYIFSNITIMQKFWFIFIELGPNCLIYIFSFDFIINNITNIRSGNYGFIFWKTIWLSRLLWLNLDSAGDAIIPTFILIFCRPKFTWSFYQLLE